MTEGSEVSTCLPRPSPWRGSLRATYRSGSLRGLFSNPPAYLSSTHRQQRTVTWSPTTQDYLIKHSPSRNSQPHGSHQHEGLVLICRPHSPLFMHPPTSLTHPEISAEHMAHLSCNALYVQPPCLLLSPCPVRNHHHDDRPMVNSPNPRGHTL